MIVIEGKYTEAVCYAEDIDERARRDIRALCDQPLLEGRQMRIMPDAHANGDGTLTGFTMLSKEPVILGLEYGSGCGVCCARLEIPAKEFDNSDCMKDDRAGSAKAAYSERGHKSIKEDGRSMLEQTEQIAVAVIRNETLQRLDEICHEIPAHREDSLIEPAYKFDFSELRCYDAIREAYEWPTELGSLGGGNHFIELDRDEDGNYYLVVHNGLGGLSNPAVRYYRRMALQRAGKLLGPASETPPLTDPRTAPEPASENTTSRSEAAIPVNASYGTEAAGAPALEDTCLYGHDREDFLHDMRIFQEVCRINRTYIVDHIAGRMGFKISDYMDVCHHYTDEEDGIVRHGAIAARQGQRVIIPVNAREGCILGTGKGNPDWNCSAPHGGGRLYSRSAARRELSLEQYREDMKDVYTTSVSPRNLDEAPLAYRSMETIIREIEPSVHVDRILRPVYSYKG